MKTFLQFIESQELNYTNLGFPPWARTEAGQYFLTTDGKINFVASDRKGVMDVGSFKKIYDQFFAKDITPQKEAELVKSYGEKMHYPQLADAPVATNKPPEIYQGKGASWVGDESGVVGKIGGQQFSYDNPEEFQQKYDKIKHSLTFDRNQHNQKQNQPQQTNQQRLTSLRQQNR